MSASKGIRPIIFIGAPRSGTTVISEAVLQHPLLAWPSNYQDKWPVCTGVNLIRRISDNSLWCFLGKKRQMNVVSFWNRLLFTPGECYRMWDYLCGREVDFRRSFLLGEVAEEDRAASIRRYFRRMVRIQGRERLAFKLTGPARMGYLLSVFPDAIFVNVRRRLVPNVGSLLAVGFWKARGGRGLWWRGAYSIDELQWAARRRSDAALIAAFQINRIREAQEAEERESGAPVAHIDYERFVCEPEVVVRDIVRFCGLDMHARVSSYLASNPVYNRNRPDEEYFDVKTLTRIQLLEARREGSQILSK